MGQSSGAWVHSAGSGSGSAGKGYSSLARYLEPKWGPLFWLEKALVFGGALTFKNRGFFKDSSLFLVI